MNAYLHGPARPRCSARPSAITCAARWSVSAIATRSSSGRRTIGRPYRQLWDSTTVLARALLASGVRQGDRVGIWSPNRFEWVLMQFASARIGAILVNINPAYKAAELRYALVSPALLADPRQGVPGERLRADGRGGAAHCPALREAIVIDTDWMSLLERADASSDLELEERESILQFDDPVNIQYTSGTTGFPKGATLSHHNILNNGFFVGETIKYTEQDRVCIPVPFYHCFGMVLGNLACTSHGACMVVPAEAFDPLATLETIAAERCTSLYGVPTMFIAQLDSPALRRVRFDVAAHRHHGRLALPHRSDEAGPVADAHAGGHDLLRHDRDLARLDTEQLERSARSPRVDGRPRPSSRRNQDRRSRIRRHRPAWRGRRALHARLQRDDRLLGQRRGHARTRSTRPAGCTQATSRRSTKRGTSTSSAASRT